MKNSFQSLKKGFTLIELLVVIAVMGVLATIVLVAVDPAEQFARSNDAGRKNTVNTLGNALNSYLVAAGVPLAESTTWTTALQTAGEIKVAPAANGSTVTCGGTGVAQQNGWCYDVTGSGASATFAVWGALDSKAESAGASCTTAQSAFFVYSSGTGKACVKCGTATTVFTPSSC